jgi:hypothetical protein
MNNPGLDRQPAFHCACSGFYPVRELPTLGPCRLTARIFLRQVGLFKPGLAVRKAPEGWRTPRPADAPGPQRSATRFGVR